MKFLKLTSTILIAATLICSLTLAASGEGYGGGVMSKTNIAFEGAAGAANTAETLQNKVISSAADPWLFYYNGYYYFTATGSKKVGVRRSATLSGLQSASPTYVFSPSQVPPLSMYSRNLWSPEIHYFSADDFGAEYAGWYLFIACDDGNNVNHRMYVLKSQNGEPDGQYVNPVTGAANIPMLVDGTDDDTINNEWACGQTLLRYGGKCYAMWVGEAGRQSAEFEQYIYIAEMENPWTFKGKKSIICKPTLDWEMNGYGYSSGTGKWYPKVVEGATAVYGDNGEVYLIYSGSGYWTTYYSLGQLTLTGTDPLEYKSWLKADAPILTRKAVLTTATLNGSGHASFTKTPAGERIICYHAYTGMNTDSGRAAYLDTYEITKNGVVIGDGSRTPVTKSITLATSAYTDIAIPVTGTVSAAWCGGKPVDFNITNGGITVRVEHFDRRAIQVRINDGDNKVFTVKKSVGSGYTVTERPELANLLTAGTISAESGEKAGIRLSVGVNSAALEHSGEPYIVEFGVLAASGKIPVYISSRTDKTSGISKAVAFSRDEGLNFRTGEADGRINYSALLTNIPQNAVDSEFSLRGYCVVCFGGDGYIVYGETQTASYNSLSK